MQDLRNLDMDSLLEVLKGMGEPSFRAKQISEWLWKKNADSFEAMKNIPVSLQKKLAEEFSLTKLKIVTEQKSADKTIKFNLKLQDDNHIEMVLIPSGKRVTVCVSSQAGCALGCTFCATGNMGFVRDLTAYEIYEQIILANALSQQNYRHKLSNIVIMGMGEPLLNIDNVCDAIARVTSNQGMAMSPGRITLSTVGIADKIRTLADRNLGIHFAISLHTANESKRKQLMPVAKNNSLFAISQALVYYHNKTNQRIIIEYLLLANINDSIEDAQELALFCKSFPVKINIIEYNLNSKTTFAPASKKQMEEFVAFLLSKNMLVQVRSSRGRDIKAACGQLATENNKQ
jgi:23S rRNA (adenine2503-C2)-methyltransferase